MPTFDAVSSPTTDDWAGSRRHAHYASQLVAAAGVTLLDPDPHHHYSSLTFDPADRALVGAPLPGGRRVGLVLPTLTLVVDRPGGRVERPLLGGTVADAAAWLSEILGTPVDFPAWDMPDGPTATFGPFAAAPGDLASLADWFGAGHQTLTAFTPPRGTASSVRVWPHHFDIATLVTLVADPTDPEASRTTGLGMTPGDGGTPFPYLYVTPWPYPATWSTPDLPTGRWNTEGWYGAVLAASEIRDQAQVDAFVAAAFAHCAAVALGAGS